MNLPNKLTIIRMAAVPVFLIVALLPFRHSYLAALLIFCFASVTDYFDGNLARKNDMITNFGKFLDPLADKMLTTSALLLFISFGNSRVPGALFVAFITLFREFLVSGIRLSAVAGGGKVIAANIWGKAKTVSQMVAIIVILLVEWLGVGIGIPAEIYKILELFGACLMWVSAILTVVSGTIYVIENSKYVGSKD